MDSNFTEQGRNGWLNPLNEETLVSYLFYLFNGLSLIALISPSQNTYLDDCLFVDCFNTFLALPVSYSSGTLSLLKTFMLTKTYDSLKEIV